MVPDNVIVRRVKEYDRHLSIKWNNRRDHFEVWRDMPHGSLLVTPVTEVLYSERGGSQFMPLDQRLLWWLYYSDSWKNPSLKDHALESDKRWKDFERKQNLKKKRLFRDHAKDTYSLMSSFYTTKHKSINSGVPSDRKPIQKFVKPDQQKRTSRQVFMRSRDNIYRYGYKK